MKIQTFRPDTYKDCKIYYRNSGTHWEYLTVINNEIYTASITVKPTIINRLMYLLGIEKSLYSYQQQLNTIKYLRRFAETTIEYIIKNNHN